MKEDDTTRCGNCKRIVLQKNIRRHWEDNCPAETSYKLKMYKKLTSLYPLLKRENKKLKDAINMWKLEEKHNNVLYTKLLKTLYNVEAAISSYHQDNDKYEVLVNAGWTIRDLFKSIYGKDWHSSLGHLKSK